MAINVGIITYHSAYNFGSYLQAFATQEIVRKLGYEATIINYRMKNQKKFYSAFRLKYGIKVLIKDVLLIPFLCKRKIREKKYEDCILRLSLTKEICEPEEFKYFSEKFDCYLSGSDQIWNKHSCELDNVDWKYMHPYLLTFTDKKKISYASSTASMDDSEIDKIVPYIVNFNHLSFREQITADCISNKIGKPVDKVLDPTLLITKDEWEKLFDLKKNNKKYIFYYSLDGYPNVLKYLNILVDISKSSGCKVKVITPFLSFKSKRYLEFIYDAGPVDFLDLIYNATLVVTDSYHGTLFSIIFEKIFYSISDGERSNIRKDQILKDLELSDHIIKNEDDMKKIRLQYNRLEYKCIKEKLQLLRCKSIEYLDKSICS